MFHRWLIAQRQLVPRGSAMIKAIDYSLKHWRELTHFVDDGNLLISNNWVENQIRPVALGRANGLFAGSLRAGQRAAAIMSLLHSARINGHELYAYIKNVWERLPTHPHASLFIAAYGFLMAEQLIADKPAGGKRKRRTPSACPSWRFRPVRQTSATSATSLTPSRHSATNSAISRLSG